MAESSGKPNQRFERLMAEMRLHVGALVGQLDEASSKTDLLANLFVQVDRLHRRLAFHDVVQAIHETMVNLIGTEDFALFVRDDATQRYRILSSMGPASSALAEFQSGEGPMGAAAASGKIFYGDPIAVVPLASGLAAGAAGVLAIMSLLSHKPELSSRDRAQLEVLAAHGGVALEAAFCAAGANGGIRLSRMRELLGGPVDDG